MYTKCALVLALLSLLGVLHAFDHTLKLDFPGPYCALQDTCCKDRRDGCSVPISTSLCYCDEFCDRNDSGDCCPDYRSFCFGEADPIMSCVHNGIYFHKFNTTKDNCNECRCLDNGVVQCDKDLCLTDDELVHSVNSIHQLGWSARKYDEWWGHKYSEGLRLRLGTKEPTYRVKAMTRLTKSADNLPPSFNSVEKWSSYISEVPDQGWCGASWVLSTTSVASDRFAIQSQGKEVVQLSAQNILSCTRRQQGCEGGHLDAAWRYLHKKGVVDERCYPYVQRRDNCKIHHRNSRSLKANGCKPAYGVNRDSFYTVGPAYSLNKEKDIMAEIHQSGPVQATMRIYRDFFSYSGGIYKETAVNRGAPTGFHSVKLVGWGEEHGGEKYWIAANSWGPWWGERGYFRIKRGTNECGIEEYVLASWPYVYNYYNARSP
ncbi:Swim [Drosophila busckii]|uniref:Swim n=1 Tax=Drosophila busckii TaxID=30019 RepID=A0A0M4EWK1_DROBS|nr:tubulointerstitial nephritis antigen-like [Drosophila busckii]XP_017837682.1 tubulointerstitial nephritis antigen-like [Drosophila busckii]XP_017837683.1 tubulointerstitial nephritis antigen-like [Drosophila busckii]ALC42487.1 Swim [Drosophila busckii]